MKPRDLFLRSIQRQPTPRPAIGSATSVVTMDMMDHVGVAFPDAHLDAEKMAALAETSCTVLGYDCVMPLFSVWHESAALGSDVDWGEKHRMPDCSKPLCADIRDEIRIPPDLLSAPECAVPLQALRLLKERLGDEYAVVGKAFGPWTLGYHVFGVAEFLASTLLDPDAVKRAMRTLMEVTVLFGQAQIDAGADALCLADHATRDLCRPEAYRDFLMAMHQELHSRLPAPIILHICGDTADRIRYIRETGLECFHFDSKVPTPRARQLAGEGLALMGGTSNFSVVREGDEAAVAADVAEKLACAIDVIGPECAVPLDAPFRTLRAMADEVTRQTGT